MKKTIVAITALGILGSAALVPTRAVAQSFFLVPVLLKNENKNFKAVNPYEHKKVKMSKRAAKKKM